MLAHGSTIPAARTFRAVLVQHRPARVAILLAATFLMGLADLHLTLTYAQSTGMIESNPVARLVMSNSTPAFITMWKLATMVFSAGVLFLFRRRLGAEIASWFCFMVLTALSLHWFNYASEVQHLDLQEVGVVLAQDPRFVLIDP